MKAIEGFEYLAPKSVEEAVSLLKAHEGVVQVIAGGTDLVGMMKDRVVTAKCLVDVKGIPDLAFIRENSKGGTSIGALTEIADLKNSQLIRERYPSMHEATEWFATPQVRNMATIGGNICRSSPSADMVPPLLTFDSELKLVGPEGERTVLLEEFFTGPGANVLNNEILVEIRIPSKPNSAGSAFKKLARSAADLATANCAVRISLADGECKDIAIALGAVAPTPIRARKVEKALTGVHIDMPKLEEAVESVMEDIKPIGDVRSSAEYRVYVSKVLIKRLVIGLTGIDE
jgi:carbon-monoxide dehydrogenase medium subunit